MRQAAAALFSNWDEALIWSCLQGHMGVLTVDHAEQPTSAYIDAGDFCFFAGAPSAALLASVCGEKLLVPRDAAWAALLEAYFGARVTRFLRYATKKEPDVFCTEQLRAYVATLDARYELRLFDEHCFLLARQESWSADLCSQFWDYPDYSRRAVGVAILHGGALVAGASPYAVYDGGIEIEIDTKPEYRRQGLATVCGARLILECLRRGLYPSWDAHDKRSLALAEKLGYHLAHPYVAYELHESP